jgi:hypothetical protein
MNRSILIIAIGFLLVGSFLLVYTISEKWQTRELIGYAYYVNGEFYGYTRPHATYEWRTNPPTITYEPIYQTFEHSISYYPYQLYGVIIFIVGIGIFFVAVFVPNTAKDSEKTT